MRSRAEALAIVRQTWVSAHAASCASGRIKLVFGVGNPEARADVRRRGPGADEDAQGVPFVGRAGQLLTQIIEAMGLGARTSTSANVLKCRPPGNRNPEPDEIERASRS